LIKIYQGESLELEFTVVNEDREAVDLSGASAKLFYRKNKGTVSEITCTIASNVITAKFTPAVTALMQGKYEAELKMLDSSSDVDMLDVIEIEVIKSLDPDFGVA